VFPTVHDAEFLLKLSRQGALMAATGEREGSEFILIPDDTWSIFLLKARRLKLVADVDPAWVSLTDAGHQTAAAFSPELLDLGPAAWTQAWISGVRSRDELLAFLAVAVGIQTEFAKGAMP
jgi:hypothetical protein